MNWKSARTWASVAVSLAILLTIAVVAVIAGSRQGVISYPAAFGVLGHIAIASLIVAALGIVSWVTAANTRSGGMFRAALATFGMLVMFGLFYFYQAAPPPGPFMNDVTTDLDDPPEFIAVLPLRPAGSNPAEYGGPEVAANQRQTHPDIEPLISTLSPQAAFDRALEVAEELGWDIVDQNSTTGRIEAVDTTPFFRFKDDVVVRIRPHERGSRIDLRSHSRIGLTDLGKNASRIMTFLRAYPVQG